MARRIRSVEFAGSTLFTSSNGVMKSASLSADFYMAGMPRALDPTLSLLSTGTPVLMANNTNTAYRVLWGQRDANNNLIYGAPSSRIYISNTAGGTRDVQLVIQCLPEITTSHFFQVYRTTIASTSADPGDEMALVYEGNPTSSDITAGSVTVRDITPDIARGDALYTNATQEGIFNQNDRPPLCTDLVIFRDMVGYANATGPQRVELQFIGTSGLTTGTSTITIGGVVYTANTAETVSTGTFLKSTTGTAAQQIEATAQSLVRVINGYAANTQYYAYYVSTTTSLPGTVLIEERSRGGSAIAITCNSTATGATFSPIVPTSGTTYVSTADRRKNRITWSKPGEPEAAPEYRYTIVGSQEDEIQRVIALRDSCIVVKDRTIWRITGSAFEDLSCTLLDDTTSCAGRDSYAKLNNTIFGLSNQGFIAITDNGVQIVGRPEEHRVLALLDKQGAPDHDDFVGVGVESQRVYVCRVKDAVTNSSTCYVYNAITRSWTRWLLNASCFAVSGDRIYYGLDNNYGHVLQQRNSRRDGDSVWRDFSEDAITLSVSAVSGSTLTATITSQIEYDSYVSDLTTGMVIYDGSGNRYLFTAVAGGPTYTITLDRAWTGAGSGTFTVYRSIPMTVEWQPRRADNPGTMKQFGAVTIKAETQGARAIGLQCFTEIDQKTDPVAQDWTGSTSSTQTLYVSSDGQAPSSTSNDFGTTVGNVIPNNTIQGAVPPERAIGEHLGVRVTHDVADSRFGIKALVVETRPLQTTRGRQ